MSKKTKDVKERIKKLLVLDEDLKDDDKSLIAQIWVSDLDKMGIDAKQISFYQFLKIFIRNKMSNPETIRRCRQQLQQHNIHLRGQKYNERHTTIQANVKKELGYGN